MVTLSAFLLAITSEAANSLLQQSTDIKFSQVPKDTRNYLHEKPKLIASLEER